MAHCPTSIQNTFFLGTTLASFFFNGFPEKSESTRVSHFFSEVFPMFQPFSIFFPPSLPCRPVLPGAAHRGAAAAERGARAAPLVAGFEGLGAGGPPRNQGDDPVGFGSPSDGGWASEILHQLKTITKIPLSIGIQLSKVMIVRVRNGERMLIVSYQTVSDTVDGCKILRHLWMLKLYESWEQPSINWCRISQPSTGLG